MLTFTYTSRVETTWSSTVSVKLEVKTTLECGIPLVAEGKIEISTVWVVRMAPWARLISGVASFSAT
jgi:hypothetical protein